jgi:hypothetical protein
METTLEVAAPIKGPTGTLMVMAAHRYCLGRQSYIVFDCIEWLKQWWTEIDAETQRTVVLDTVRALQEGDTGSEMDAKVWKGFAQWGFSQLTGGSKEWCQNAAATLGKPWPL